MKLRFSSRPARLAIVALAALAAAGLHLAARSRLDALSPFLGLEETIFDNVDVGPQAVASRIAGAADLSALDERPDLPRRFMSARWQGFWVPPAGDPLHLTASADDEVRVWVDDDLVVDWHVIDGFRTRVDPLPAAGALRRLRIEYVQRGGGTALSVRWAGRDGRYRPLVREALFPYEPTPELVRQSGRALLLRRLAQYATVAAALLAVALVVMPGAWALTRRAAPRWQAVAERAHAIATTAGGVLLWPAAALLVGWTGWTRAGGLDPPSLWADDVWMGAITRLDGLGAAVAVPAPVAPGFVAVLWWARQALGDPEWSLQIVPFACGLAGPVAIAIAAARLLGSRLCGFVALCLALTSPVLAQYSVFVKPYSLDFLVAAVLLWLAVDVLGTPARRLGIAAMVGLAMGTMSIPAGYLLLALVHVAWLAEMVRHRGVGWRRSVRWVIGVDLALAALYGIVLAGRSTPALRAYWARDFVPSTRFPEAFAFLGERVPLLLADAAPLPPWLVGAFVAVGLAGLLARAASRWYGVFLVVAAGGVVAASALQLQPLGTGAESRTVVFFFAVVVLAATAGLSVLLRLLPGRTLVSAGVGAAALWFAMVRSPAVSYPALDHARMVQQLTDRIGPGDALVLNTSGAYLTGHYGTWPVRAVPDASPQGFAIEIARPLTVTVPRGAEYGEGSLDAARALILSERPGRVFVFSTRRSIEALEALLRDSGYAEEGRATSSVSTFLIEYQRSGG
jgi:hypothetical protein